MATAGRPITGRPPETVRLRRSAIAWLTGCGLLLTAGLLLTGMASAIVPAVAAYAAVAALIVERLGHGHPFARFGLANGITLIRVVLLLMLAAAAALAGSVHFDTAMPFALAAVALGLDGLDGRLARGTGEASAFGARFDMEADAAAMLLFAIIAAVQAKAGLWVLAAGSMRYAFIAASLALPWLSAPLPPAFRRKAVCVVALVLLAILLHPAVTPPVSTVLALAAVVLLAWSFLVDCVWLARSRAVPHG